MPRAIGKALWVKYFTLQAMMREQFLKLITSETLQIQWSKMARILLWVKKPATQTAMIMIYILQSLWGGSSLSTAHWIVGWYATHLIITRAYRTPPSNFYSDIPSVFLGICFKVFNEVCLSYSNFSASVIILLPRVFPTYTSYLSCIPTQCLLLPCCDKQDLSLLDYSSWLVSWLYVSPQFGRLGHWWVQDTLFTWFLHTRSITCTCYWMFQGSRAEGFSSAQKVFTADF